MKTNKLIILIASAGLFNSCAAVVPQELVSAREAYQRASTGRAAQAAPAQLHVANEALAKAERSFQEDPESYQTRDLAYVAERKSEMAEATASIVIEQKNQTLSRSDYQATQGKIITNTKQDLSKTRMELTASEHSGELTAEQLSSEKAARAAAEKQAADAQAALAKLAAVKQEPRGMVITLSGSVLFASNQATLLPEARTRLDQVADVLLTTRERNITVEGHTDSQGSDSHNMDLSQRRADAVRSYLIQRGYEADRIKANGIGEGQPIANNGNAEGRANNRRVEIVIERDDQRGALHTSNP
jgi:outer membrane protein OmpA-like peptidoglycan-associated protein